MEIFTISILHAPSYGLLLLMVGRTAVAVLFSLALYLSPFLHWWYLTITFATIGLGLCALACFLAAQQSHSMQIGRAHV